MRRSLRVGRLDSVCLSDIGLGRLQRWRYLLGTRRAGAIGLLILVVGKADLLLGPFTGNIGRLRPWKGRLRLVVFARLQGEAVPVGLTEEIGSILQVLLVVLEQMSQHPCARLL